VAKSRRPLTLSIIVPVFNEEKTVIALLKKVQSVKLLGLKKQIIVVNDGSNDKTIDLLGKVKIPGGMILHHEVNRGKGGGHPDRHPPHNGGFCDYPGCRLGIRSFGL